MARKSQILKLITAIVCLGLFIVLLLNVCNAGYSYYYIYVEQQHQIELQQQQRPTAPQPLFPDVQTFLTTRTDLKLDYAASEPLTFELITEMEKKIPSLPFEYFYRHSHQVMQKFKNCAQYPAMQVLNFFNTYWQTFHVDGSIYQLYGAYYDDRPASGPVIRILALSNRQRNRDPTAYCQLWYEDDNRPILATVKEFQLIWDANWGLQPDVYYPFLMTCEIPKNASVRGDPTPKVVNLVARQCDTAKNSLRIARNKLAPTEKQDDFAVCVKGLDFPYEDLSVRLVEWLELLRLLGVQKVIVHSLQMHANMSKVLNYYQSRQFVEVQEVTLVGGVVAQPELNHWLIKGFKLNKRLNELIAYNDCFYRNLYKYKYIALLDIDEIIMPKGNLKTWQQLLAKSLTLEELNRCPFAGLCAANVYFPIKRPDQQVPAGGQLNYLFMLNHAHRLQDYTLQHHHVKCLHSTQHVLTLHNHYPLSHLNTSCASLDLPTDYAQLQHYRDLSASKEFNAKNHKMIRDNNLERFRQPLTSRIDRVLTELGFLN